MREVTKNTRILLIFVSWGVVVANEEERNWDEVYEARVKFVEQNIGKLPDDILKILHMSGVWPGGGLYKLRAEKYGENK